MVCKIKNSETYVCIMHQEKRLNQQYITCKNTGFLDPHRRFCPLTGKYASAKTCVLAIFYAVQKPHSIKTFANLM